MPLVLQRPPKIVLILNTPRNLLLPLRHHNLQLLKTRKVRTRRIQLVPIPSRRRLLPEHLLPVSRLAHHPQGTTLNQHPSIPYLPPCARPRCRSPAEIVKPSHIRRLARDPSRVRAPALPQQVARQEYRPVALRPPSPRDPYPPFLLLPLRVTIDHQRLLLIAVLIVSLPPAPVFDPEKHQPLRRQA